MPLLLFCCWPTYIHTIGFQAIIRRDRDPLIAQKLTAQKEQCETMYHYHFLKLGSQKGNIRH
jgi:hypothetical protein